MTRFEKRLLIGLGLLVLLLSVLEAAIPEPMDWTQSYSRHLDKPYASELVYESLGDLFPEVRPVDRPFYEVATERLDDGLMGGPVNHLLISGESVLDEANALQLLDLAEQGDHFFVAAAEMEGPLADTLNIRLDRKTFQIREDTSDIRFAGDPRIVEGVYRYARGFHGAYFTRYDTARTRVLAIDGAMHPVLLEVAWGRGRIVLCSAPLALTNFNLLKNDNATAAAAMLSTLPSQPVLWHEYRGVGTQASDSLLRFLLSQPPLRWAWFLTLSLVVLFILVRARREQRAIPVVAPPRNASRELVQTMGRLYWSRGDHVDLAQKMIANFKEDLRQRAYLRTFAYDEATAVHLAAKSGLTKDEMTQRLSAIQAYENAQRLSEFQLLKLNEALHELRRSIT
jgi:hypothetical protein